MHRDGGWHCVNEYRAKFIFNGWKRRIEIEGRKNRNEVPTGRFIFKERACEHGTNNQKDYRMEKNPLIWGEYTQISSESTQKAPKSTQNINESTQRSQQVLFVK